MANPITLPSDMKLYSPAEPKGRVFLKGEQWPGDAWSDKPGGDDVGKGTVTQALKDLQAAEGQAQGLRDTIASQEHDLAQLAKERDDAVSALKDAEARAKDAEKAGGHADDTSAEITKERDTARAEAASQKNRADALDGKLTEAQKTIERMAGELAEANQAAADGRGRIQELETDLANAKAKIAPLDGDGDGKPGGSKSTKAGDKPA